MLVTGDNSLQLFLGWEGVGLASYLLIHFWFTRLQADKAAIKAMLVNRVGDFGLAPGISGCFTLFQTVDFSTIFACASAPRNSWISCNMRLNAITLICILLLIGAVGKSAQIGSHTWSPDAMEGPTPVSALIHAATMVTAGVFMIARCSPLFEYPPTALIVITFAGAMTSFLAATTGILQNDLKRVIAYSTCSQLGYMIFACGISNYSVSVFHLMNHAFFKALLFLSAGSVIHAMSDEQDMRKMGGLASSFPFTYAMMLMGSLSLIGFPFLTGFYSKDVILELAYTKYTISGNFAFWSVITTLLASGIEEATDKTDRAPRKESLLTAAVRRSPCRTPQQKSLAATTSVEGALVPKGYWMHHLRNRTRAWHRRFRPNRLAEIETRSSIPVLRLDYDRLCGGTSNE
ncbi:UNVERIFIED_CONTAM: NADH-ubiquinone oxidoreductase chain 5 [Sesamum latifolium]|uniref:NADH-ubiquinone oxidoreductase chain 5 n=1 Tax=Sesamum latifolium TaxID=2727402 RepID=A0AAW2SGZ4_9LAMI